MLPRILVDTTQIPGGDGQLKLYRRGDEFSIMLGGNELMNSRLSGSEEALATIAREKMPQGRRQRVLIGGLGMGFTLRAALGCLGDDARITVAELVPAVVEWAHGPMTAVFGNCLADPRVEIRIEDVSATIRQAPAAYEAILLDVDNGPDGLTHHANDRLYDRGGLHAAYGALAPGGVLAIWSCAPDAGFTRRLQKAGFDVDERVVRANRGRNGGRHVLWFATRR